MGAMLIVNYDVTDPERFEGYRKAAGPILVGKGKGRARVVSDASIDLEEGREAGRTTVVLEFESVEAALDAFKSAEYQAVLPERLESTDQGFAIIVPTLD